MMRLAIVISWIFSKAYGNHLATLTLTYWGIQGWTCSVRMYSSAGDIIQGIPAERLVVSVNRAGETNSFRSITQLRFGHMIWMKRTFCHCSYEVISSHWIRRWMILFGQHDPTCQLVGFSANFSVPGALGLWGLRPHAVCVRACQCQVEVFAEDICDMNQQMTYCDMTRRIELNLCFKYIVP